MVGVGMLMLVVSWLTAFLLWRNRARASEALPKWIAYGLVAMTFSGWVATLAGWYVTEIGRQPWLVTGVLTTAQAASKVPSALIATSLSLYLAVYAILIGAYISALFYLAGKPTLPTSEEKARGQLYGGASTATEPLKGLGS
jgi:cytochrome d ubiquinol oxidase subunit I